jgi:hypothetical protein
MCKIQNRSAEWENVTSKENVTIQGEPGGKSSLSSAVNLMLNKV